MRRSRAPVAYRRPARGWTRAAHHSHRRRLRLGPRRTSRRSH